MAIKFKPLGNRLLVQLVDDKLAHKGTILIPETAKERPVEGIVCALGTGREEGSTKVTPFEMEVGDRVLVNKYGGTEITIDTKEFRLYRADDIIALIQ